MNKNTIIGFVLLFGIFIGYMWWISPSKEEQAAMIARRDSIQKAYTDSVALVDSLNAVRARLDSLAAAGDTAAQKMLGKNLHVDMGAFNASAAGDSLNISIQNNLMQVDITNMGAMVERVTLSEYRTYNNTPLHLITPNKDNMNLVFSTEDNRVINTKDLVFTPYINGVEMDAAKDQIKVLEEGDSIIVSMRAFVNDDSNMIQRDKYLEFCYTLYHDRYDVDFDIHFHGLSDVVRKTSYMDFHWSNNMSRQEKVDQSSKNSNNRNKDSEKYNSNIYFKPSNDNVDQLKLGRDDKELVKTSTEWIAFKQQFFCAILMADSVFENADLATTTDRTDTSSNYLCDMSSIIGLTYNGDSDCTMGMSFYYGPSKYRDLRSMKQGFERMLPLGWGFFLTQWISRFVIIPVFNFLEQFNWNYGIIIIVLTFLMRLVLFPLTYKSYQGSAIMKILRPEMEAINKKYPNPDQAMQKQQEMMRLQRRAGYNPMAGCLPVLIQMPILLAMFRFYPASIELRQQPFLWCDDLSTYDSILDFGFTIPFYGDHVSLFCLLMFGMQFFYTWYTMRDQQQTMPGMKFMMYFMPFMMLFIFNSQSAALNLYYFCSLSLTMIQMVLIRKFTSEKKVRARMVAYDSKNQNKPQKKSKFQKRLEEMQRMTEEMQKQQQRQQKR